MNCPAPRHWALGLALSLAAAWLAGAMFLDTVQPVWFDAALGRHVAAPGTTSRTRNEGWASSHVGEHGIRGLPAGRLPAEPKVVFWGDSYVEGLQVDDGDRMAQQLSALAAAQGLVGIGVANGGDALPDFLIKARSTTPALGEVKLHVFVLARMTDTLPDIPRPGRSSFRSQPELRLEAGNETPSPAALTLAPAMRKWELAGAFAAYERLRGLSLRLAPGPVPGTEASSAASGQAKIEANPAAMYFLVRHAVQTAKQNGGGVVFLHLPHLPRVQGQTVALDDSEERLARDFAAACSENGAGFIDLGTDFRSLFNQTGRFPSGFFNSPPGSGHLNEEGHRLVAKAVAKYIQEHPDALLAR